MRAMQLDMIGFAMGNGNPSVVPSGRGAALSTNPISYAVPAGRARPIVSDFDDPIAGGRSSSPRPRQADTPGPRWKGRQPETVRGGAGRRAAAHAGHMGYDLSRCGRLCGVLTGAPFGKHVTAKSDSRREVPGRGAGRGRLFGAIDPRASCRSRTSRRGWMRHPGHHAVRRRGFSACTCRRDRVGDARAAAEGGDPPAGEHRRGHARHGQGAERSLPRGHAGRLSSEDGVRVPRASRRSGAWARS